MEKNVSVLLLFVFAITTAFTQKTSVPAAVIKSFNTKFPGATAIKWSKENSKEYEAEFKLNNTSVSANFGLDGDWKETETTIRSSELPVTITDAVNSKYPGAVYFLTEKIEKPGNKFFYEVNIKVKGKKKELEIDSDGHIVE